MENGRLQYIGKRICLHLSKDFCKGQYREMLEPDAWYLREFITVQTADSIYHLAAATVGLPKLTYSYDADTVLFTESTVDGASQSTKSML